ncbi:hypothetical protein D3C80_1175440 [compost metagenome]
MAQGFEQREVEQGSQQQAEHQDRLAADAVRQPAEEHEERRADHHADNQQGIGLGRVHLEHLGEEEQHVELRGVEGHRLSCVDAEQGSEDDLEVGPGTEGLTNRRFTGFALCLHFHEGWRFVHAHANPGGDRQQHDRQQERQAPAPDFELVTTDVAAAQYHQQRQQQTEGRCRLDKTGVEATFTRWRMLSHIGCSAAILTTQRQALKHTQDHQNDRCGDADTGVGR